MRVTIWGCRGSIPAPGPQTIEYGGNTSSVEVTLENGGVLVLDAGSGIRGLGAELQARGVRRLHLLLTHLHLDHLEGLRFFGPLFDERVSIDVWGPRSPVQGLRERIRRSFSPPLFPIDLQEIPAQLTFHDVPKEPWSIEGARIVSGLVMHPGPTVGYRIEADGVTFAYIPDHEPALTGEFESRSRDWISGSAIAEDADVLLHDAQYSAEEYGDRIGWGHSSVESALAYRRAVGARRLVLFHHDPQHADRLLEELESRACSLCSREEEPPILAREGMVLDLS